QGAPARVEVRARMLQGNEGIEEYRLPERELPSGVNELDTLCIKAPFAYGLQCLTLDVYRDGCLITQARPPLLTVHAGDWRGGRRVVTGGPNRARLNAPSFADLLPVRGTGAPAGPSVSGPASVGGARPPAGTRFVLCSAVPKPGSQALASDGDDPVVASGPK